MGQPGGWKAANCGTLVTHAIGETDKWIANDAELKVSTRQLEAAEGYVKDIVPDKTTLEDEGIKAQTARE